MPPLPLPNQAESGRDIKQLLAHRFDKIGQLSHDYLYKNMNDIAKGTINDDIDYLQKIHVHFTGFRKQLPTEAQAMFADITIKVEGQISSIIPLLYSAHRASASKDMDKFYEKIQASRTYWQNILDLLHDELR